MLNFSWDTSVINYVPTEGVIQNSQNYVTTMFERYRVCLNKVVRWK